MKYFRAIALLSLLIPLMITGVSESSVSQKDSNKLDIRTGVHDGFIRVVLEGGASIIPKGEVSQKEKDIIVSFNGQSFEIKKKLTHFSYKKQKDNIIISVAKSERIKTFKMKNPDRLVIDVYGAKVAVKNKPAIDRAEAKTEVKSEKDLPDKATINREYKKELEKAAKKRREVEPSDISDEELAKMNREYRKELEKANRLKKDTDDDIEGGDEMNREYRKELEKAAKLEEDQRLLEEEAAKQIKDRLESAEAERRSREDSDFVPEQYKGLWTLLNAGNFYAVLKELPNFKPHDSESLAIYHYMYGDAYKTAQQYLDAIKHLRLAYIYAENSTIKERALFDRARIYQKLGLLYESRANYIVFIKEFPKSDRLADAHLGLADTLSEMGLYKKAVNHYRNAGTSAEILFSMANTLQKIGRVSEARKTYADALAIDRDYPSRSPETYFYIGENMRTLGELEDAKRHLSALSYGSYKDNARLSLGHIAMDEKAYDDAAMNFRAATKTKERKVKVEGHYYLAKALSESGNHKEAIESLEVIKNNYINSEMYKDTLLDLAKLQRRQGNTREAVSLLKELVYGKKPPREAFAELEGILLEAGDKKDSEDDVHFIALWNEVGQWLIDETREDFLVKINEKLRHEGKPFLDLSTWIVEKASRKSKYRAAVDLADYYIGIGNIELARQYMKIASRAQVVSDAALRCEAKLHRADGKYLAAIGEMKKMKEYREMDLDLLGSIISGIKNTDQRLKAIDFYESVLNKGDWDAEQYNRLADMLHQGNKKKQALKYYKIAHEKKPEDEWASYMVGEGSGKKKSEEMFLKLEKEDSLIGRLAKTKMMEINLINKVKEVY